MADKSLTCRVSQLQKAALSQATQQAYRTGLDRYKLFCEIYSIIPRFPTTELSLCYFSAYLSEQVQYPTVKLYLAAVRSEHITRGMQDPLKDTPQLSRLLHGLQRKAKKRTRLPISPTLLQQIIQTIMSNHQMRKHDQYLYATAICMAYFGCLRGGEVSYPSTSCYHHSKHLTLKDVSIQDNTIILQLKQSKTDQLGKGSKIVIGQSKQAICPVKITRRFLQYRQQANHSDALFRLKDGSLLTRQRLQSVLRKSLTMLNLPAKHFGTHSLRIGSATAAAQAGVPVKIIKALGRWSSDCYRRYIRAPHKSLQELASKLCAPPP